MSGCSENRTKTWAIGVGIGIAIGIGIGIEGRISSILSVFGELGFAILGNPVVASTQADVATYGAGVILPLHERLELVGGVNGRQGPLRIGNENRAQMQAGIRIRAAGFRWDVAGIAGLKPVDATCGLSVGLTYEFQAFGKKPQTAYLR